MRWLPGYCATTEPSAGDCAVGDRGSWVLSPTNLSSWDAAMTACLEWCERCVQCRAVSVSRRHADCSWFALPCDRLQTDVGGFRTLKRSSATSLLSAAVGQTADGSSHTTPHDFDLERLRPPALLAFDIFVLASPGFWQDKPSVVVGFFRQLKMFGDHRALLITSCASCCEGASSVHGIPCAVSKRHAHTDNMLSK